MKKTQKKVLLEGIKVCLASCRNLFFIDPKYTN
jgi:hypothetical protein